MSYFYVICPVGGDPSFAEKKTILETLGRASGVEPFFPLDNQSFSTESAINAIKAAQFVLADVSLERPSCYFELGIAEALKARVALIASTGTAIHQVGNSQRCLFYSDLTEYRLHISRALATAASPLQMSNSK